MLKKSASGVLAALRGSTYRSVRLASSLAAALLDGLFEHPAWCTPVILGVQTSEIRRPHSFFPQPARSMQGPDVALHAPSPVPRLSSPPSLQHNNQVVLRTST